MNDDYDFHPKALIDPEDVWESITENNPTAANRVVADILDTIEKLVPFPHRGYRRPDLTSRPLRFTNRRDYPIAYVPDEKPLWVVAAIHGRRSPRVMAAILRARE